MNELFSTENSLEDVHLDLTPLIDAVFMLLVFFIMATTFSKPVLDVMLPRADSAAAAESATEQITLTITHDGRIVHEANEIRPEALDAFMAGRPATEGLIFNVDRRAPFSLFVLVLDAAKKHGKSRCAINTTPDSDA